MNKSVVQPDARHRRPIEKQLKAAQIISAVLFLPFLVLHLSNALLGIFGPDTYDRFQTAAQQIYHIPVIEFLFVLAPLLIHMVSGLALLFIKRHRQVRRALASRMHTWAGLFLALVILGHVIATRGLPWAYGFHAGFSGVAFSLWWMPWYFYPYYFLLFMAGAYHSLNGSSMLAQKLFSHRMIAKQMQWVMLFAAIAICIALLSFGGNLRDNPDPRDNDFARLYQTLFNLELKQ